MKAKWLEFWAQFPELERQAKKKNCMLAAALMCIPMVLALVIFVAVLMLSGCAVVDDIPTAVTHTHETTWLLSTQKAHLTKVLEPVRMQNGKMMETTNFSLYVYECSATYARISAGTVAQTWIPRAVLTNDECDAAAANDNGPLLDLQP